MSLFLLFSPVLVAPAAPPVKDVDAQAKAAATELARLAGAWKMTSVECAAWRNTHTRDWLTVAPDGEFYLGDTHGGVRGTVVVDPAARPKTLDFRYTEDGKEAVCRCIYELDGDSLRVLMVGQGKERPASFRLGAEERKAYALRVFERLKDQP